MPLTPAVVLSPVSTKPALTPVLHRYLQISSRIFKKILGGPEEDDSCKNPLFFQVY
jgi:hypothetical protein